MKTPKNEKRYITKPTYTIIKESNYKRKDDLYCIVDHIYRRQMFFKNALQKNYGFVEVPRSSFLKLIPNPNYVKAGLDFLIESGIILRNDYFVYGIQAKGYKVKSELLGSKIGVEITDKNINYRIKKNKMETRKKRVKNLEFAKSKYYKTFKLDQPAALEASKQKAIGEIKSICLLLKHKITDKQINDIIECQGDYVKSRMMIIASNTGKQLLNILHRLMVHQQQIYAIGDGFLYFSRNKTNGRLDSNLTSLPSYLRKFLISDEKLFHLDIKNSQPYFLYTKLINEPSIDKDELKVYGDLVVNGQLYEFLIDAFQLESKGSDQKKLRDKMKKILFGIFYSKVSSYAGNKEKFRTIFPTIMQYIDETNCKVHNSLAIIMQERESSCILDNVMVRLQKIGINPFTIHDSFIITENELPTVKSVFFETLTKMFGIVPQLHEEDLFDAPENHLEDELFDMGNIDESFFYVRGKIL